MHSPARATVSLIRELHLPASDRSCVHVEVDISSLGALYVTGDHIAVFAELEDHVVDEVATYMTMDLDSIVSFAKPEEAGMGLVLSDPIPGPLPLRRAV